MDRVRDARPRIAVVIASAQRPADVAHLLGHLRQQTHPPQTIVLSVPDASDAPPEAQRPGHVRLVLSRRGLPCQRNAGVDAVSGDHDLITFFDDDFLPEPGYLAAVAAAFADATLVAADGDVVADGAVGAGIDWAAAQARLAQHPPAPLLVPVAYDHPDALYGCNMTFRAGFLRAERFDERLVLYGWLEDRDMSCRAARRGRIARVMSARGIHLGVKRGRTSGLRLGYSQVANPLYLWRQGTMSLGVCLQHLTRRPASNLVGTLARDPHVDRPGRLRGNLRAFRDALLRRDAPENVLDL